MLVFAFFVEVAQAWQVGKGAQLAAPASVLLGGVLMGLRNWVAATFPVTTTARASPPPRGS